MKKTLLIAACFFALASSYGQAPDRSKMEQERKAIQAELQEVQSTLNKVKGQKKESLGQLNLIQKKVNLQGQFVNNINKEIRILSDDIYLKSVEINKLQQALDTLKSQYARSVVYAYKNRSSYNYINFIFSASNFNDALRRISYLRSYREHRQEQVANIVQMQQRVEANKQQLLSKKTQKSSALQNQTQQLKVLEEQRKEKDAIVAKLKSQESDLARQIAAKKKRDAQLKKSINIIIQREIAARRAEEERRRKAEEEAERRNRAATAGTGNAGGSTTAATPRTTSKPATRSSAPASMHLNASEEKLAGNFLNNKGKLPWPVDNGFVSIHFGSYKIPDTRITGDNPGITITTPSVGAPVKAVFDGEVIGVFNMGDGMAVTISHGNYFTTYSNLSGVNVTKGSNVSRGQAIGRVGADDDGGSGGKLDFILMVNTANVNPEPWLRRP